MASPAFSSFTAAVLIATAGVALGILMLVLSRHPYWRFEGFRGWAVGQILMGVGLSLLAWTPQAPGLFAGNVILLIGAGFALHGTLAYCRRKPRPVDFTPLVAAALLTLFFLVVYESLRLRVVVISLALAYAFAYIALALAREGNRLPNHSIAYGACVMLAAVLVARAILAASTDVGLGLFQSGLWYNVVTLGSAALFVIAVPFGILVIQASILAQKVQRSRDALQVRSDAVQAVAAVTTDASIPPLERWRKTIELGCKLMELDYAQVIRKRGARLAVVALWGEDRGVMDDLADLGAEPGACVAVQDGGGKGSYIAGRIRTASGEIGAVIFGSDRPRTQPFHEDALALVRLFANWLSVEIDYVAALESQNAAARQVQTLMEAMHSLVIYVDPELNVKFFNREHYHELGSAADELLDQPLAAVYGEPWMRDVEDALASARDGTIGRAETSMPVSGTPCAVECLPTITQDGSVEGIFVLMSDISQFKEREQALMEEAALDPLTGLLNRRGLERAVPAIRGTASVILIDMDNFKAINDKFGHLAGDQALRRAARILEGHCREGDLAVRMGGDEFLLVVRVSLERAKAIARRVRVALANEPFVHEGNAIGLAASTGVARLDRGNLSVAVAEADRLVYRAKRPVEDDVLEAAADSDDAP